MGLKLSLIWFINSFDPRLTFCHYKFGHLSLTPPFFCQEKDPSCVTCKDSADDKIMLSMEKKLPFFSFSPVWTLKHTEIIN